MSDYDTIQVTRQPNSRDAEEALIGSVLIYPDVFIPCSKYVEADYFYIQRNAWIWQAFEKMNKGHVSVDLLTVSQYLDERGQLAEIGGQAYLLDLVTKTPTALHAEEYAKTVRDYHVRRKTIQKAGELAKIAYDISEPIDDKLPRFYAELVDLIKVPNGAEHVSKFLSDVFDDIAKKRANPSEVWGIPTGFPTLDRATGGLQKGTTIVLSGPPGLGKSIMALQMAFRMASKGHPGVVYELEMSKMMTLRRQLSVTSGIPARAMQTGYINDSQMDTISEAFETIADYPIYLSDSSSWNTTQMRADLTALKHEHGIEFFVVDYLQQLSDRYPGEKETERIGYLSQELHNIAKDLDMCGIIISSMTKEGMNGVATNMTNLYGGSKLQHGADFILMLEADVDRAGNQQYMQGHPTWKLVRGRVAKDRDGATGIGVINFAKKDNIPEFVEVEK